MLDTFRIHAGMKLAATFVIRDLSLGGCVLPI